MFLLLYLGWMSTAQGSLISELIIQSVLLSRHYWEIPKNFVFTSNYMLCEKLVCSWAYISFTANGGWRAFTLYKYAFP